MKNDFKIILECLTRIGDRLEAVEKAIYPQKKDDLEPEPPDCEDVAKKRFQTGKAYQSLDGTQTIFVVVVDNDSGENAGFGIVNNVWHEGFKLSSPEKYQELSKMRWEQTVRNHILSVLKIHPGSVIGNLNSSNILIVQPTFNIRFTQPYQIDLTNNGQAIWRLMEFGKFVKVFEEGAYGAFGSFSDFVNGNFVISNLKRTDECKVFVTKNDTLYQIFKPIEEIIWWKQQK